MAGLLRAFYLCYLSRPRSDRTLYRVLRKQPIRKLTQLGIGTAERTLRMLELCRGGEATSFAGIDLFEMRRDGGGLPLKEAHKKLAATGAKIRLLPGDPYTALARGANALGKQDLILISADQEAESLARAWFYLPRLMHETTAVILEQISEGAATLRIMPHDEVTRLAERAKGTRAA